MFVTMVFFASGLTRGSRVVTVFSAKVDFGHVLHPCVMSTTVVTMIAFYLKSCIVPGNDIAHVGFRSGCCGPHGTGATQGVRLRISSKMVTCVRHFRSCDGANCHFSLSGFGSGRLISRLATHSVACSAATIRG